MPRPSLIKRIALFCVLVGAVAAFFVFEGGQYLTFDAIKAHHGAFEHYYDDHRVGTLGLFFILYVLITALSLPGAGIMTVLAGALFGLITGTVLVSFASSIGATLAMITARYILRDWVQSKFSDRLKRINDGIKKDGLFYLFTLRLVPIIPFFVINIVFGLVPIRVWSFYWVSQVGMLAGTLVYVFAGTQLATIQSIGDIASPKLMIAFVLIGVFPFIARKIIQRIRGRNHAKI